MALTLITQPGNKNSFKSLIAAQYAGVVLTVPEGFEFGKTNRTPEFLKLNPNGKVSLLTAAARGFQSASEYLSLYSRGITS